MTNIASSDFAKFIIGALSAGSIWLLVVKISDSLTKGLVRKAELKQDLEALKKELTEELVTSKDLQLLKLEQAAALEAAMKESRHTLKNELQSITSAANESAHLVTARLSNIEQTLARIDEHLKIQPHPTK